MTTYLLGDSHLDHLGDRAVELGDDVVNLAVGGSTVDDLPHQVAAVDLRAGDLLVVSIGTNDADPTRGRSLAAYVERIDAFVGAHPTQRWVYVRSPGARHDLDDRWTRAAIAAYAERAASAILTDGGPVLDTPALLSPLGAEIWTPDGFHLTDAAYDVFVPALGRLISEGPT